MNSLKKNTFYLKEYKELYDSLYFSLCLFSDKYVNDIDLSKDIVQNVFIKIWNKKIVFESEHAIKTYLYRAVRNKSLDYLKSKEHKIKSSLNEMQLNFLESEAYFEKEFLVEEVSRQINLAVDTLPKRCKEIMRLSLKGLENSQISEELCLSVNTVKAQKRIAYQKLKPLLKHTVLSVLLHSFLS